MTASFNRDPHPGRPRILFVGSGTSSHTNSWIDLLEEAPFNVRLFALPTLGLPPDDWRVRTYISGVPPRPLDRSVRKPLNPVGRLGWGVRHARNALGGGDDRVISRWLERIVRGWRPHIVHTLGLEPSGYLFKGVFDRMASRQRPVWVAQVRGGPDLALHRFLPEFSSRIEGVLESCDQLIADNRQNYEIAVSLGLPPDHRSSLGVVPGTGGVLIPPTDEAAVPPSLRDRTILWPKAYDCPQSTSLPVLEALHMAWSKLAPCTVHVLAATRQTRMWFQTMPEEVRASCFIRDRIPRRELLELMSQSRVMVAPSLADGVPNTLYEAMAHGAFPVVSPLETITPLVDHERNGLLARNLHPDEIAAALVRAMADDELVDSAAEVNLGLVRRVADRTTIRPRVIAYYEGLANRQG